MDQEKTAILYVITNNLNNFKYYGIIYKEGKTIEQRLEDHIKGRSSGKFIHKAIEELGKEHFCISEVERGELQYIIKRETEESAKCLWVKREGYNGNTGKCIILDDDMKKKRLSNTNQIEKSKKWRETYDKNKHLYNYTHSDKTKIKQENINYSQIRGQTKYSSERLKKLSNSIKERWKNPTTSMLNGIEKMRNTMKGQTKENCNRIKKFVDTIKNKDITGENAPNFKYYWMTPLGRYSTAENAARDLDLGLSTLLTWCSCNKKIYKNHYKNNDKIIEEWNGKYTKDIGFRKELVIKE